MMLSDDHLRHLVPMPPPPCGCAPRPWPRPVVPVPVTPQMQPHWAEELRRILDGKQDAIADLDEIRAATVGAYKKPEDGIPKTDLAADVQASLDKVDTAYVKPDDGIPKTDLVAGVQASLDNADTAVQPAAIAGFVDGAEYDADYGSPPKPTILMKHGSEVVATVDATDFVIDGMVSNVEVKNGYLVITFNTDSGRQPISIPLTDIFDPDNYYTKTAANNKFKTRQTPVQSPPTELTTTNAFIDTISQNANGVITPTKRGIATVAPASATDSGQVADALAVKNALAGKASTAAATLTQHYTDWVCSPATSAYENPYFVAWDLIPETDIYAWCLFTGLPEDRDFVNVGSEDENATEFSVEGQSGETVVATRTASGYDLGDQTDKPLASEAEAEALRTALAGKLDKSSETWNVSYTDGGLRIADTAGLYYIDISPGGVKTNYPDAHNVYWPINGGTAALLENLTGNFSSSTAYAKDALVVYLQVLYRCINPNGHTGAWVAADFAVATIEDVLAALRTALAGKENASNKVTSLSAQSTDTQYPSAKCVYDAIQGVDVKPTRIYNEAETDALDDKGQLYKSSLQGNYWTVGAQQYNYVGPSGNEYIWQISSSDKISYNKNTGVIQERRTLGGVNYSYDKGTVATGLNPANGDIIPSLPGVQFYYGNGATFTPLAPTMETTPYAHFSLESLPDRTWAVGVWAVGDLVKYNGKAYRCKADATSSSTTAPSSDTTHWTEIPVLAQKADRVSSPTAGHLASLTAMGDLADSGKGAADFMAADAKVKELFNADENVKCDGEGQVFKPGQTGNYWTWGSSTYNFTEKVTSGGSTFYNYGTGLSALSYNPATGLLTNAYGQAKCQCGVGLNPLAGDDISPTDGNTDLTFTKLVNTWPTNPTDLFARVSDLAAFSATKSYAVGDIAGYDGKVYKCTTAHTGAWNASHFTLATKAEVQAYLAGIVASIAGKADTSDLLAKLDASSAAPAFSSDSSVSYPVDSRVTYNGKLYKCTTATTGGTWDASKWTADTMTDPDAVLDITSQNQLRVVAKDGTLLWAQGYDLASTSSATLACDAVNNFTFADGATTQAFTLPTAPTGKVGDFGLDIDNSANMGAATMTLTGLDSTFSVVVPKGESLNDMLAIAAGELAQFYITLSTFRINNLPTWHIVKQVVENGGAQS